MCAYVFVCVGMFFDLPICFFLDVFVSVSELFVVPWVEEVGGLLIHARSTAEGVRGRNYFGRLVTPQWGRRGSCPPRGGCRGAATCIGLVVFLMKDDPKPAEQAPEGACSMGFCLGCYGLLPALLGPKDHGRLRGENIPAYSRAQGSSDHLLGLGKLCSCLGTNFGQAPASAPLRLDILHATVPKVVGLYGERSRVTSVPRGGAPGGSLRGGRPMEAYAGKRHSHSAGGGTTQMARRPSTLRLK